MVKAKSYQHICLIGLGLMGSCIGLRVKQDRPDVVITGFDGHDETRSVALERGFVDKVFDNVGEAVSGADLVVLCVPIGSMAAIAEAMAGHLASGTMVTDVGSVKQAVIDAVDPHIPGGVHFVPGHPIAGSEKSGPTAGYPTMFDQRWCVLTPLPDCDADALARLERFWHELGSDVEIMTPEHHDVVLAITSHLPHLIAYSIVSTASDLEDVTRSEVIKYSAGGFRDFTRIAASDPTMWRDVFLTNKKAVLEMLGRFSEDLSALQRAIRWEEGDALFDLFTKSRDIRKGIIDAGQDTAEPDFGRVAVAHSETEDPVHQE